MRKNIQVSERISRLSSSLVREILAAAQAPGMISFAGGLPSAEAMPILPKSNLTLSHAKEFLDWQDKKFQQYGESEGEPILREQLSHWLADLGIAVPPSQTLVVSGSQQAIDLCAKLLVDPGSVLLCESPTYLAALQTFQLFGATCVGLPLDHHGISPDDLAKQIETKKPRAIYLIPSFQNPSGSCYSAERRREIAAVIDHYQLPLIEDEPYRELAFDSVDRTPLCSLIKNAPWIYLGSFSKTLWPGWRVGFLTASEEFFPLLVRLKQAGDLHTNRPGQIRVAQWLMSETRAQDLKNLRSIYTQKRDAMQMALQKNFGDIADWQIPSGGLFFWLQLRKPIDTRPLLQTALQQGVAFMPGEAFFPSGAQPTLGTVRLNFSHASETDMQRGLEILSRIFREAV